MDDSFQHHSSSCSDSCGRMQQMLIFKLNVGVLKEIGIPYIPPTTFCLWTKLSKPSPGSGFIFNRKQCKSGVDPLVLHALRNRINASKL